MGESVNFSFNKGQAMDITKFDGVSKEELLKKEGLSAEQKALIESIFVNYDDGDGILTADEYSKMLKDLRNVAKDDNLGKGELKQFNKNLGADKKAYSMEDLQAVIGMMTDDTDNIVGAEQDGDNLIVTYKPEEGVGTRTATFAKNNNNLTLLSDDVVNGDVTTHTEYIDGDADKISKQVKTNNNPTSPSTVTKQYSDDGKTGTMTFVKGALTKEYILNSSGKWDLIKDTTDKGQGGKDIIEYDYDGEGNVIETHYNTLTGSKDKPAKVLVTDGHNNVKQSTEFTYDDNGSIETTRVGDGEPTVVKKDNEGKVIPEPPTEQEYQVKNGEAWYNIVAAKYGVKDHKTIMEIVHQLKDNAGIKHNNTSMPKTITLPNEIMLKNGEKVTLDIDAAVDSSMVSNKPKATPPVAPTVDDDSIVQVDPNPPVEYSLPPLEYSLPPVSLNLPPTAFVPIDAAYNTPVIENAGQTITNPDGTKTIYDKNGYIIIEENAQGETIKIINRDDRKINSFMDFEYDSSGNLCQQLAFRNEHGAITHFNDYEHDDSGNNTQVVYRNAYGVITSFRDYEYDASGNMTREIHRTATGAVDIFYDYEYDDSGNKTREVHRNADGSVDYYLNCDDYLQRNPDGTLKEE